MHLFVPENGHFLALVHRPEHGAVSQACVDMSCISNERENGLLDVSCRNAPRSKLDLAEVVLEAPPTLIAYKMMAGSP